MEKAHVLVALPLKLQLQLHRLKNHQTNEFNVNKNVVEMFECLLEEEGKQFLTDQMNGSLFGARYPQCFK